MGNSERRHCKACLALWVFVFARLALRVFKDEDFTGKPKQSIKNNYS
jgi:hypothetical protein